MGEVDTHRIMIVEGDAMVADELQGFLEQGGHQVIATAARGDEAVQQAQRLRPELAVIDLGLAGPVDAVAAARQIREQLPLPIVFVAAAGESGAQERTRGVGASTCLYKPVRGEALRTAVAVAVLRHGLEQRLRDCEARFHGTFDEAAIGMALVTLDGRILQVNRAFDELLGRNPGDAVHLRFIALVHPEDLDRELGQTSRLLANGHAQNAFQLECRLLHASGHAVWTLVSKTLVRAANGAALYVVVQLQDIQARKGAEERLFQMTQRDTLTGLPNHEQTRRMLEHAVAAARRRGEPLALMLVDLDGFKLLNDALGADGGDALLCRCAETIAAVVRESDLIGRWGSDEFAVLLQNLPQAQAERVAHKVLGALAAITMADGPSAGLSASVGIAVFPHHADTVTALLRAADTALQRARQHGGARVHSANTDSLWLGRQQMHLEHGLRRALEARELQLHYQPIYRGGHMTSVEALLRWSRPGEGLVSPADFIDTAERCGLLVPMGSWILETACRQMAIWRGLGSLDTRVAVNLSARQFRDPHLLDMVRRALDKTELPAEALELEITEPALMQDLASVASTLQALRDLGTELTVDDFGTGYSSIASLRKLPIDRLKIDRSFVHDVPGDADAESLVQTMLGMARNLGLSVVAEGVETPQQMAWLQELGCERLQGYGLHRPVPAESLGALH